MESSMRKAVETELKPANVYEDLGRGRTIVIMVFITQAVLISFVVIDIMSSQTFKCPDGTPNCPIFGTFGSWSLYVLGIFMACVYILGPKTSFGQSEQNPAFWLQLLLISKRVGTEEVSTPEDDPTPDWCTPEAEVPFNPPPPRQINTSELSDEAERIINEAMEKLNALKRGEASTANISMRDVAGSLLMMPRAKDVASFRVDDNGDGERAMPLSQSQNPIEGATLVKNGKGIDAGDGDGDVDP
ncbi:hypothetical protein MHU86_20911 [Fragilaria crotonensis]|nr:hypothetical protein MHU86_20911 [Fragilaria crotonensis]